MCALSLSATLTTISCKDRLGTKQKSKHRIMSKFKDWGTQHCCMKLSALSELLQSSPERKCSSTCSDDMIGTASEISSSYSTLEKLHDRITQMTSILATAARLQRSPCTVTTADTRNGTGCWDSSNRHAKFGSGER